MPPAERDLATVGDKLREGAALLAEAGVETPALDVRLIAAHVLGLERHELLMAHAQEIAPGTMSELERLLRRRAAGEPVSRILSCRDFWSRPFKITPATLDPRPETETLIETALAILAREGLRQPRLLDIGTGSGCILVTLLAELPGASGTASDVSLDALKVARCNALRHGVADRIAFRQADMLAGIEGPYDMLLSNPPYIPRTEIASLAREVARHDPLAALDGGMDGLDFYRRIVAAAPLVAPGGWILLEVGHDQAAAVLELAAVAGAIADGTASTHMDLNGHSRCVAWKTHT